MVKNEPIIRGLTEMQGRLLFACTKEGEGEIVFSGEVEKYATSWKKEIEDFCKKNKRFPHSITVNNTTCQLGTDYDSASEEKDIAYNEKKYTRQDVAKGKIAVVTGGAQGFGEGLVRGLCNLGAFVWIADMNIAGAETLAETLNSEYGHTVAKGIEVNVTTEHSVETMCDTICQTTGGFDIFVSNAGVLRAGSVKEMTLRDFSFVTSVDYTGFFICTKYASQVLALQNLPSGKVLSDIVAISSKSGLVGSNKNGAYAGAKFGTIGLVQSFALELVTDNIKVNAICPGNFLDGPLWSDPDRGLFVQYLNAGKVPGAKTIADVRAFYEAKVPMKRGCRTEDVMRALSYIIEQEYETGQAVPVTGGQVMLN